MEVIRSGCYNIRRDDIVRCENEADPAVSVQTGETHEFDEVIRLTNMKA